MSKSFLCFVLFLFGMRHQTNKRTSQAYPRRSTGVPPKYAWHSRSKLGCCAPTTHRERTTTSADREGVLERTKNVSVAPTALSACPRRGGTAPSGTRTWATRRSREALFLKAHCIFPKVASPWPRPRGQRHGRAAQGRVRLGRGLSSRRRRC